MNKQTASTYTMRLVTITSKWQTPVNQTRMDKQRKTQQKIVKDLIMMLKTKPPSLRSPRTNLLKHRKDSLNQIQKQEHCLHHQKDFMTATVTTERNETKERVNINTLT